MNKQFVSSFADVMAKLERVEGHVERLATCSQHMRQRLEAAGWGEEMQDYLQGRTHLPTSLLCIQVRGFYETTEQGVVVQR